MSRTFEFDSIMGLGPNVNWPYDFRYKRGEKIYGNDSKALLAMAEKYYDGETKSLFDLMPILPKLPNQFIPVTNWYEYPENTPEVRELIYRCRFNNEQINQYTFLPWNGPESSSLWERVGVYEFCPSLTDGEEYEINPDYEEALDIYNAVLAEAKLFIREHFVLVANLLSPTSLPTEKTNQLLIPKIRTILGLDENEAIPDEYLWHWWFINPDGSNVPTTVKEGLYVFGPYKINDDLHPWWDKMANNSILENDTMKRAKQILGIK